MTWRFPFCILFLDVSSLRVVGFSVSNLQRFIMRYPYICDYTLELNRHEERGTSFSWFTFALYSQPLVKQANYTVTGY